MTENVNCRSKQIQMKIVECPRDAMQGLQDFIPTSDKIRYLNQLLKVGFDTLDFGSFVSPKAIPQMSDTAEVLANLDISGKKTSLLAIVANTRGAEEASSHHQITFLGFPLSISETFQLRNTNKSIAEGLNTLVEIKSLCEKKNKKLVTYISMGFGNPYGDPYDAGMIASFTDVLLTLGSDVISIADTVGAATPEDIRSLVGGILKQFPKADIGVHLHSNPSQSAEKIKAAVESGCTRIDGALKGYGGCPMAKDDLVGNIATEEIVHYLNTNGHKVEISESELVKSIAMASEIFPNR
jgi:hydroxymethylglutaryl-CoA lyase